MGHGTMGQLCVLLTYFILAVPNILPIFVTVLVINS